MWYVLEIRDPTRPDIVLPKFFPLSQVKTESFLRNIGRYITFYFLYQAINVRKLLSTLKFAPELTVPTKNRCYISKNNCEGL